MAWPASLKIEASTTSPKPMTTPPNQLANERLVVAASAGDAAGLALALAAGADVHAKDSHGLTAAMAATIHGETHCLQALLGAGANPDEKNSDGRNMATLAVLNGHEPCLEAIIAAAKDIDAQDDRGRSAAMLAAFQGRARCLNMLIVAGVDLHARDHNGATALRLAASFGSGECVRALIDAGAIQAEGTEGEAAAFLAAANGHEDLAAWIRGTLRSLHERNAMRAATMDEAPRLRPGEGRLRM
jgi:ankyrin repeat protein